MLKDFFTASNMAPIRKLVVVLLVAGLGAGLRAAGVIVDNATLTDGIIGAFALIAGYLVPDPRVVG